MRDGSSTDNSEIASSEIAALAQRVAAARGKLPLQHDAALLAVLSDAEIAAERELAEWVRAQRRGQRRRAVEDELAAEERDRRTAAAIRKADDADARWHRRALAARRRVSNQDARLAQLYRRAEWSSRALIAVVVLGMVWAGVNVQHNLVPSGDMTDPLYWLSYGIEAMISIPIITIMVAATTAARWGRELARGKVIFFESALLGTTIALNAGPHLAAGALGRAAEYAIAPVMVGVVIWLHAWVSGRYAVLIDSAPVVESNDLPGVQPSHRVTAEVPVAAIPRDEPTDLLELLAARDIESIVDAVSVERCAEVADPGGRNGAPTAEPAASYPLHAVPLTRRNGKQHTGTAAAQQNSDTQQNSDARPNGNVQSIDNAQPISGIRPNSHGAQHPSTSATNASRREPEPHSSTNRGGDNEKSGNGAGSDLDERRKSAPRNHTEAGGSNGRPGVDQRPRPADRRNAQPRTPLDPTASAEPPDDERRNSVDVINETVHALSADTILSENDDMVAELDDVEVWAVAREIAERGLSTLPVEQLAEILILADQSWTETGIGNEVGLSRAAVSRVLESARKVRRPYAVS
ncbi:hypothetical protein [Nocardia sp. NPDC057440]|uniref:hypothetical protein n=1 Tax=Nocardia sp. NPDC057440 TaxID=3346134 RepID=UPI00366FE0C6